jgi:hypothetical protein
VQLDEAVRPLQRSIDEIRTRVDLAPTMTILTASACSLLIDKQREVEADLRQQIAELRQSVRTSLYPQCLKLRKASQTQTTLEAALPILTIIAKVNQFWELSTQNAAAASAKLDAIATAVTRAVQKVPFIVIWTGLVAASVALTFAHLKQPDRIYEYYPVLFTSLTLAFAVAHYCIYA